MLWEFPFSGGNFAHVFEMVSLGVATKNDAEWLIQGMTMTLASLSDYKPETLDQNWSPRPSVT